ncbi:MAG: class I SAM-dependent methyltransferase [bacterium]|nr:class I SAM-dependent methyltransferase [bacterium]
MPLMNYVERISAPMRARRFEVFESLISALPRPLKVLDIGGTNDFWKQCGYAGDQDIQLTLVNVEKEEQVHSNVKTHAGDATRLDQFADHSFDLVFSNSVIEHLNSLDNQRAMARETQRLAPRYFVQTPNYWFPVEPHFHFIGWQWLPLSVRVEILRRRTCGFRSRTPDEAKARELVEEVALLTRRQLQALFPTGKVIAEHFLGLTKSWIVIGGFE